ncbi:TetR/AcrR family transcriptional regulator [Phytoactinopolyspora alkaliphila]|uniref:TetR/AcrR family transcriptional regulator n=1 Tax=Phytoactinopolyspora alkaliphila TaxID=1783498 RepID=A0A6N9YRV7_9ACTN|nr:TetR/AcrR family transcriptional regulator [Phytoactinopolyspora alkaliphila]
MGAKSVGVAPPERLRADASRNRDRIVSAARDVLVEFGPDVPLDTIASRAGVGNATVYRHFASRRELILQATLYSMARIADEAEAALTDGDDPFEALRGFIIRAADERFGSLCSFFGDDFDKSDPQVRAAIDRLEGAVNALMDRARRSGQLRRDVALGDLMVAVTQLTRPIAGTGCEFAIRYFRRHLQLFVDGLHNPVRSELPGVAVTLEDLERRQS